MAKKTVRAEVIEHLARKKLVAELRALEAAARAAAVAVSGASSREFEAGAGRVELVVVWRAASCVRGHFDELSREKYMQAVRDSLDPNFGGGGVAPGA